MTGSDSGETALASARDYGDVLAIVEDPQDFRVSGRSWNRVASTNAAAAIAGMAPAAMPALLAVPLVVLAFRATQQSTRPTPPVALIAMQDAARLVQQDMLVFPQGGPSVGQVYGRHPLRRRDYLPYASFHRLVLQEKAIEAARYLLSLGARDVEITCHQTNGSGAKAESGVLAPNLDDVSLTMGFARDASGRLSIRISGAGRKSRMPAGLLWPSQDPMFKLARDAAQAGADEFHFGLHAEQSGSVNAQAALKLQKDLRLGLGGEYKRWEDLIFTVDATFDGPRTSAEA